jgi:hypothetical protein
MKKELLPLVSCLFLLSCQSQQTEELADKQDETEQIISRSLDKKEDSTITLVQGPQTFCFEDVVGLDRTEMSLSIDGETVTGNFNYLPHEKDQAIGTIVGRQENNSITAIYTYTQEGNEQSEQLVLTLSDEAILINHTGEVSVDGKPFEKYEGNSYTETLLKSNCK